MLNLLLSGHQTALQTESAISDEIIKARGYASISSPQEMARGHFGSTPYATLWEQRTLKAITPALLIPIYRIAEDSTTCMLRPDNPRIDNRGQRLIKYESPRGQAPVLDILPRYKPLLSDVSVPIWITEGAKKADSLASLFDMAIVPVSINGVYGWSSGGMISDFGALQIRGRSVVLVPDGDINHNQNVFMAIDRLAHILEAKGATVTLLSLPDVGGQKVGVDDYIAAGHNESDLAGLCTSWANARAAIVASLAAAGLLKKKPAEIREIVDAWASESDGWAFDATREVFMQWQGTHWQELRPVDVTAKVDELLREHNRDTTNGAFRDVTKFAPAKLKREFGHQGQLANFQNGTYDAASSQLRAHDPADGLTYCLPFDYDPAVPTDRIQALLFSAIPDPIARLCYMLQVGLSLIGDTKIESFIFFLGPTRTGKGTLMRLAHYCTGMKEYKAVADCDLFSSELEGKRTRYTWAANRLVAVDELKHDELLNAEEMLKKLSAHSGGSIRGLNKDEQMGNQWLPKLILAGNDTPRFTDNSGALAGRLRIVSMPTSHKDKEDINLLDSLLPQAGGFASICLGLALALVRCGLTMPESQKMREYKTDIAEQNPLKAFIADRCTQEPDLYTVDQNGKSIAKIEQGVFRSAYVEYCVFMGHKPSGERRLFQSLRDIGLNVENKGQWIGSSRAYKGIRLLTDTEIAALAAKQSAPGYQHTNIAPTSFESEVGGFLSDWEAIKRAATNIPTQNLEIRNISTFASLFVDNNKVDSITPANDHENSVGVLVEDVSPDTEGQKATNITPTPSAARVGDVGTPATLHPTPPARQARTHRVNLSRDIDLSKLPSDVPLMDAYAAATMPSGVDDNA